MCVCVWLGVSGKVSTKFANVIRVTRSNLPSLGFSLSRPGAARSSQRQLTGCAEQGEVEDEGDTFLNVFILSSCHSLASDFIIIRLHLSLCVYLSVYHSPPFSVCVSLCFCFYLSLYYIMLVYSSSIMENRWSFKRSTLIKSVCNIVTRNYNNWKYAEIGFFDNFERERERERERDRERERVAVWRYCSGVGKVWNLWCQDVDC